MSEKNPEVSTEELPLAVVGKQSRFSVVWIIPIVTALLAVGLLVESFSQKGPLISLRFDEVTGLADDTGQNTQIKYRGVVVGEVRSIELGRALKGVVLKARLNRKATGLACEGSRFWIVRPEISLTGIEGLSTIVSGSYIQVEPGRGKPKREFIGLKSPPAPGAGEPGLEIVLKAEKLGSLSESSPVLYREVKVGKVQVCELANDARSVDIRVHIDKRYAPLVRKNSVFWNASGISIDASLLGVKIDTESLESLLVAGLAFATPEEPAEVAPRGMVFPLYDRPKKHWQEWAPAIPINPVPDRN